MSSRDSCVTGGHLRWAGVGCKPPPTFIEVVSHHGVFFKCTSHECWNPIHSWGNTLTRKRTFPSPQNVPSYPFPVNLSRGTAVPYPPPEMSLGCSRTVTSKESVTCTLLCWLLFLSITFVRSTVPLCVSVICAGLFKCWERPQQSHYPQRHPRSWAKKKKLQLLRIYSSSSLAVELTRVWGALAFREHLV